MSSIEGLRLLAGYYVPELVRSEPHVQYRRIKTQRLFYVRNSVLRISEPHVQYRRIKTIK